MLKCFWNSKYFYTKMLKSDHVLLGGTIPLYICSSRVVFC